MFESINPYSLEPIANHPQWNVNELGRAIGQAGKQFEKWRVLSMQDRVHLIERLGDVLENEKDKLARLATTEMGKPIAQAEAEVEKCIWLCEHYAKNAADYLNNKVVETDARKSYVAYEPMGVILGIMPWNFPYWQVLRFAVPTLLAGNTVAVKHASNVQGCAEQIAKGFERAGFPKGCYTHLPITKELVNSAIAMPEVKAVSLTGSDGAGKAVAKAAGAELKPTLLELGGSNAFIVLADADLEASTDLALKARMQNNGQSCIAAKRFIVEAPVEQKFTDLLLDKMRDIRTGDPSDRDVYLGPLARTDLAEELHKQVEASIKKGAKKLLGGAPDGAFYPPTLIAEVVPGMPVFDTETFGPVAAITIAENEQKAIFLANCSKYGLGATICSSDLEKAQMLGRQLQDGAVFINEMVKSDPRLPFGGTGISGYGRELGEEGIRAFCNVKTYFVG